MSSVEIRVLGDFDFIEQIIHGVARVYNQDGVFNTASGILLMLLLLWASIGHIMNPDKAPFPFREFLMGLIGWIVFASPMSPKYDVELTSIRDAHRFTVINDVPFIAAVPSAIASNFFSGIREIMEVSFAPVTFSSSDKEADPLSALVKMYDQRPPTSMQFKSNNKGYDLGKTITEYVQNCYVVDHELTGRDPTMSIELLRTTTISQSLFQALKVTYDFLQTDVYLTAGGSHFGTQMACPDAHSAIMSALNNTTLENNLTDFYEKKGVSREALRNASAMIYGSYGIGPSPYDIQLGMFQSYMIRDGLKNTSLENYTDQMVFQGMRKRVYEKAGERALFNQIAIPVITALECFAFYMAPIMMLLAVLGGAGFAMIKKYMMLILFVNLWSFISIFVNLYTAISVENALGAASGFDPFSFDSLPDTILEVEGFLATAAALTASIPMLAMFLLYGGVHSMMGVMRNVASGSVDGNMGAPTVSSNMNGGVQTMGDKGTTFGTSTGAYATNHSLSNNMTVGSSSVGDTQISGRNASIQAVQSEVTSSQSAYQQAFSQAVSSGISSTSSNDVMNAQNWSSMNTDTKISTIANTSKVGENFTNDEKAQMAIKASASAGVSLPGGLAGAKGTGELSTSQLESKTYQEMVERAKSFQEMGNTSTSNGDSSGTSEKLSDTKMFSDNESSQKAKTALESYQRADAKSKALNNSVASSDVISNSKQLDNAQALSVYGGDQLDKLYNSLSKEEKSRLNDLNVGHDENPFKQIQRWENGLKRDDTTLEQDIKDKELSAKMMRSVGQSLGNERGAGFIAAAETYEKMAKDYSAIEQAEYGLTKAESQEAQTNAQGASDAANNANITSDVDTVTPTNQAAVNGSASPDKEELKAQKDLSDKSINTGMLDTGRSALNLFGNNQRWDSDNVGESVNSHAVSNGVFMPTMASGTDSLLNGDYRNMPKEQQMDAIIAGNYISNNKEVMDSLSPEQQERFTHNYNRVVDDADQQTKDLAKRVESGEVSRNAAGQSLGGSAFSPNNNPQASGLKIDSGANAATNLIGEYFSSRAYEQALAIEQAGAFDHSNTNVNENTSNMPTNLAKLASTLANDHTNASEIHSLAQGENSESLANKFFGINSHETLNSAIGGMPVLESLRGVSNTYDANLDTLQAEMRNNNAYNPETVFVGETQSDGTLGETFSHNGSTYTMTGSEGGVNMYENEEGEVFRQASGSPGLSEVHSGTVSPTMINYDGDAPALNLIGGMATVDGIDYTPAGQHTIGEGDDITVLGNKYSASDGESYYLHKNQMKMILD
jgi:hypothetical protein